MVQNSRKTRITKKELRIIEVLADPENRLKKKSEICRIVPCDPKTYDKAFRNEEFVQLLHRVSLGAVQQAVLPTINAFVRKASRGSFQHGKVILEMAGVYAEKREVSGPNGKPIEIDSPTELLESRIARLAERLALAASDTEPHTQ